MASTSGARRAAICLTVSGLLPALLSVSPSEASVDAQQTLTITGVARGRGGVFKDSVVNVTLHTKKNTSPLLDHAKTSDAGAFSLRIERTPALAKYAENHRGFINLDLAVLRGKKLFMRAVYVRYSAGDVKLGRAALKRVSYWRPSADRSMARRGILPDSAAVWDAPVMMLEHAPDSHTAYEFASGSGTSLEAGYGTSLGDWKLGGEIKIEGTKEGSAGGDFGIKGKATYGKAAAQKLTAPVALSATSKCSSLVNSYGLVVTRSCTYTTQGRWDGEVKPSKADYLGCSHASKAYYFTRRDSLTHFTKRTGKAFEAVGEVGVAGMKTKVSTKYSDSVMATYWFDIPHMNGFNYCLGGVDGSWNNGSRVVVSTFPKRVSPPCPSGRQEATWSASYRRVNGTANTPC
ncbi:hypothetical protein [Nocardioides sp. T2.26MG-1]|uniref:hypothetical protein n=1 Tax=Nocardioides sp. T2.26MG-1 TaxID=3041166 RepID=UPI002477B5B7|nr:hypothetical protein [Nocardioides sp. T2.26MG-1]CAI9408358.1 hypothetical protein HIDPHFAB_01062 [Nocardioides sp. T2.26MG-1]